jgi:endogenous inhibitor of DNA gyrase (YacG/DUF329 family)
MSTLNIAWSEVHWYVACPECGEPTDLGSGLRWNSGDRVAVICPECETDFYASGPNEKPKESEREGER